MKALRTFRMLLLPLLAALLSTALIAGLLLASPSAPRQGRLGQTLALRASLHALVPHSSHARTFQDFGVPTDLRRGSDGRYIYKRAGGMRAGALVSRAASAAAQVDEAVQTFDAFNPPPAFSPAQTLAATNLTPVWTADQTMLVFSSNRTSTGAAGTRFHIWAVPVNGGTPVQLTSSTGPTGGGEFFPALSASNNQTLVFTSDAKSAGVQNLYSTPFTAATVAVSTLTSPTLVGTDASGNSLTGFSNVGRAAFSPNNSFEVVFSALSTTGTNAGHSHLYYLYLNQGGYDPTNPALPAKVTDGPADDTDPAFSQDGLALAFASTATKLAATGSSPSSDPETSLIRTSAAGTNRNIFVIGGGGTFGFATVPNSGNPVTVSGTDNFAPAWSTQNRNIYLNPVAGQEYIAFSRGASPVSNHEIYYVEGLANNASGAPTVQTEAGSGTLTHLNTDDAANAYDDIYPTWSPFTSIYSIAYSSNRTVTYTDPAAQTASETAISVAPGSSLGSGVTVGSAYAGLLESQVLNLDPPTLLPYSGNEIVHITNSGGAIARANLTPGGPVTITVRLSDREAGVDPANVYAQIKDPDSKYQDAQGLEHKVFAKDLTYRSQTNAPAASLLDSGSSTLLLNGGGWPTYNQFPNPNGGLPFEVINRGSSAGIEGPEAFLSGTAVASDTAAQTNTPVGNISIGTSGGGTSTEAVLTKDGKEVKDGATTPATLVSNPPGSNPNLFTPWGPEFECQVVNPQFAAASTTGDTSATDYRSPYYLAGFDDQQPFSGSAATVRPTANGTDTVGNAVPAEWLKLTLAPQQDGQGGLLYTVTWTTPTSGSDFYLDVVAFDKAAAPPVYTTAQAALGVTTGSNWRIYDNIWGFSTSSSIGNKDILVVSDYALGQKFAATTFGGATGFANLVPKLYGAESYVTDVDVDILPNAIYRHYTITGADPLNPNTEVLDLGRGYDPGGAIVFDQVPLAPFLNGLGVGSYNDIFIDDGTRLPDPGGVTDPLTGVVKKNYPNGIPAPPSQQYSLWRILSRGPLPASVYTSYEPKVVSQPAVNDPTTKVVIAAGTALNAYRCILWLSPFTGDVVVGAGTLTDSATQSALRSFVKAGGRLCITGQDIGSSLTQNGTTNNSAGGFLPDVLNATLATSNGGTHLPANGAVATDNRLTFSPSYDDNLIGLFQEYTSGNLIIPVALDQRLIRISNNYGGNVGEATYIVDLRNIANWRTDGSLDQLGPYGQTFTRTGSLNSSSVNGQIDTVVPGTGAHVDQTLAPFTNQIPAVQGINVNAANAPGGAGLIYTETPITATGGGSKVVYATFGLEALSSEFYRQTSTLKPNQDTYQVRNVRQGLIHNIVSYLRTGTITGTIRSTTGNGTVGSGISGATVYLQSGLGPVIPGRGTYSATTDSAGNYTIFGVEPGSYIVSAYRTGFVGTSSNKTNLFIVEGDTTQTANLSLATANPGTLTGTVTDTSKNPVAGAAVSFTSTDGQTFATTTNSNGVYSLASAVPPGTYIGTASKAGFGVATSASTAVTSGATVTVNFTLKPGPGTLSGTVKNSAGVGISGATVFLSGGTLTAPLTATTLSDGTYSLANVAAGSYTIAASATGYGTSAALPVTVSSGANTVVADIVLNVAANGTLGGLVTATGSSAALSGVTLTIVNTATQQTITTKSTTASSPAAPAGDGKPLNYSISLLQGTYTVTASVNGVTTASQTITVPPSGFARVDFTGTSGLQPVYTFPAGVQFVSTPYNYTSLGFNGLFGTLDVNRSNVVVWNPLTGAYALDPTAPADALRPGVGYWVFLKNATPVTQTGTALTGSVSVALNPSWNQIGVPSTSGISVNNLTFTASNGTTFSFADASGSTYHLVSPLLYSYNGTSYQSLGAGATLQPWQAYWIKVFVPVTVNLPTGK